jgi:hypothetical protein
MNLRREATKTIWKTVVFAGAMLGTAACSKSKPAPTTPDPAAKAAAPDATADGTQPNPCADPAANPCGDDAADPCADPCADRVRGVSDEGDVGRGFVLS